MIRMEVLNITRIRKAVGAIIVAPEDKFLLVHKVKISDAKGSKMDVGFWDFIKGGIQGNETMLDAVKREILEETGIDDFMVMKELSDTICFEFPAHVKKIIEFDAQETTMYVVRLSELPSGLMCKDDEIDGYDLVNKDKVYDKLSQIETKKFWNCVIKEFDIDKVEGRGKFK